ncbi:hypothetical protein E4U42_006637 [Claviceps africana]|uniref:Mitochondrial carrier protein n=1 Tax=Claviceps africana TaxID=83212 RepID=A0A8K0NM71_9HYPO|nr:hypothetical protein E4U42_006637 [Claviceps africana]
MSTDFWAGYISGVVGILVGNPLDIVKVRLQAGLAVTRSSVCQRTAGWTAGAAAPVLGYGALNALLFVSYNRSESALQKALFPQKSLIATWLAGAAGGFATWVISAPTEIIKCRAQISDSHNSSWRAVRTIWQTKGLRGFYLGGLVTAVRDSVGYGFYFWSYELAHKYWPWRTEKQAHDALRHDVVKVLLCGGFAGVVSWASVFPLDTIKTRLQVQQSPLPSESSTLIRRLKTVHHHSYPSQTRGPLETARGLFREGGLSIFFRGLTVCSIRAFAVNAAQWAVYEWVMMEFSQGQ